MKNEIIKELHNCGRMFFISATGGGTSFIGEFLKVSGGSKCIAGGYIPYAVEATNLFVGGKLDKYADGNAARKLAVASFEHCLKLNIKPDYNCVGVGIACSLVKDNEREGREHHISIAIHTVNKTIGVSVIFKKSKLNRIEEENIVNDLTLFLLYKEFSGKLPDREWENQHRMIFLENDAVVIPFNNTSRIGSEQIYCENYNYFELRNQDKLVIYPGSFNPLHSGHIEIHDLAEKITGCSVYYELSIINSYKPQMDYTDLEMRYSEFKLNNLEQKLLITKAPRFVDKINLIKTEFFNPKQIIIVVGADTWERVYDATAHKNGDIKFFEDNNVKFLVFGRNSEIKNQDSPLFLKHDIALNYSNSISSTELRKKR